MSFPTLNHFDINIKGELYSLSLPKVMGILNITPDSFYPRSRFNSLNSCIERVNTMIEEGMDILDIGSVSTRPGSTAPSLEEEKERIQPFLKEIVKQFPNLIISVDTYRSEVAKLAVDLGSTIINDISGGCFDEKMLDTIANLDVAYIMMHTLDLPSDMQNNPTYDNVTIDLINFFSKRLELAREKGLKDIIIDPGFGFGKNLKHNYQLLRELESFKILNCPILVGMSRKSMLSKVLNEKTENMLNATTIVNTLAIENGANIIRVHDIKEAKECIKILSAYYE